MIKPDNCYISLSDFEKCTVSLVGGKAANLARLYKVGFAVPESVIITSKCFEYISDNKPVMEIEKFLFELLNSKISCYIDKLKHKSISKFAIRSSATVEDSPQFSYAGVFSSFLNVEQVDIPRYVLQCWESCSNDRIRYYESFSRNPKDIKMAVIIQLMIPAIFSGVAFSVDPLTFDQSNLFISCHNGIGMLSKDVQDETLDIVLSREGFKPEHGLSTAKEVPLRLIQSLGQQLIAIELEFGKPVDIEWAWDGHKLWILQARPATNAYTDLGQDTLWSSTNFKEILPEIPSPATWSSISYGLNKAFETLLENVGYSLDNSNFVTNIWGRGYINITLLAQVANNLFGFSSEVIVNMMGGEESPCTENDASLVKRGAQIVNLFKIAMMCHFRTRNENKLEKIKQWRNDTLKQLEKPCTYRKLREIILEFNYVINDFMFDYILVLFVEIGSNLYLQKLLRSVCLPSNVSNDLLIGLEDLPSTRMTRDIIAAAELAKQIPVVWDNLTKKDWRAWNEGWGSTDFRNMLQHLLQAYGHRTTGAGELEIANQRWSEKPESLFEAILAAGSNIQYIASHESQLQKRKYSEKQIVRSVKFYQKPLAYLLIRQAQHYTRQRELYKHHLLYLSEVGRRIFCTAGDLLLRREAILEQEDVFFLTFQQVLEGLTNEKAKFFQEIVRSKARMTRFRQMNPPNSFVGSKPRYPKRKNSEDAILLGTPCSPGIVTANASLVYSLSESPNITPGNILVCPAFDSTWLPLFFACSGIIVEMGGLLSHGSIIVRELGIPTVINVQNAMAIIRDGAKVNIDGYTGIVSIL